MAIMVVLFGEAYELQRFGRDKRAIHLIPEKLREVSTIITLFVTPRKESLLQGLDDQYLQVISGTITALCLENLFVWGNDFTKVKELLSVIEKAKTSLYINLIAINIHNRNFHLAVRKSFNIDINQTNFLVSPQHLGRINRTSQYKLKNRDVWGYSKQIIGSSFILRPQMPECDIVKKIFKIYTTKDESLRSTGAYIRNYISKKNLSNIIDRYFYAIQVQNILKRPEYCGCVYNWDHTDSRTTVQIPNPIITYNEWQVANEKLNNRSKAYQKPHWTSGRVFCSECGQPYYYHKNRKQIFHINTGDCDYRSKIFSEQMLEDVVTIVSLIHADFNFFSILEAVFDTLLLTAKQSKASSDRKTIFADVLEDARKHPNNHVSQTAIERSLEKAFRENKTYLFLFNLILKNSISALANGGLPNIMRLSISLTDDPVEKAKRARQCLSNINLITLCGSKLKIVMGDGSKEIIDLHSPGKIWRKRLRIITTFRVYLRKIALGR